MGPLAPPHAVALSMQWAEYLPQLFRVLACCYVGGIVVLGVRVAARRVRLQRAMQYRIKPSRALQAVFDDSARQMPSRGCKLWVLPGLASPATLGWWRPQILVPSVCEGQDATELREAFWHELKHIERRDALWSALSQGCQALLWFHPGVRSAMAALGSEREIACDLAVVHDHPQSRDIYATCLLRFARLSASGGPATAVSLELTSAAALLDVRIRSILTEPSPLSGWSRSVRIAGSVLLLGVSIAAAPALRIFLGLQPPFIAALPSLLSTAPRHTSLGKGLRSRSHLPAQRHANLSASKSNGFDSPVTPSEHDPKRAAENRAGLNILTESTGYEDSASQPTEPPDSTLGSRDPAHASSRSQPSWTSVALEAAQGFPLGGGHDHDHDGH